MKTGQLFYGIKQIDLQKMQYFCFKETVKYFFVGKGVTREKLKC